MRITLLLCLALSALSEALPDAIQDWHKPLTGIPITKTRSLAPRFHRRQEGRKTESHIYVASEKNVLAALHPTYGTVVWRHLYDDADRLVNFRAFGSYVASLSGPGGANLRVMEATTGYTLLDIPQHNSSIAKLSEPADIGTDIVFVPDMSSVIALTNSKTVRRVSLTDGHTLWSWTAEDDVSLNVHSRLVRDPNYVYVISMSKSFASYQLHITVLDHATGKLIHSYPAPGNLPRGLDDLLVIEHALEPSVAWLEKGAIQWFALSKRKVSTIRSNSFHRLIDVGLTNHGMFIAEGPESATVYRYHFSDKGVEPRPLYVFTQTGADQTQSPSTFSGGIDKEDLPYVSRVFYSFAAQSAGIMLYAPHGSNGTGLVTTSALTHDATNQGIITHVALDVAPLPDGKYLTRALLTNTIGAIQLWKGHELMWTREESLSALEAVTFVDLPGELNVIALQLRMLRYGPQKAAAYTNEQLIIFISGRAPPAKPVEPTNEFAVVSDTPTSLARDAFGFRKIIVAVSSAGKIFGIDSASGKILWSRILALDLGRLIQNPNLSVVKSVLDGAISPVVAVIANRADGKVLGTVVVHLDAMTGQVQVPEVMPPYFASQPTAKLFSISSQNRSLALISNDNKAAVYPHAPASLSSLPANVYFTKVSGLPFPNKLSGYTVELGSTASAGKLAWTLPFGSGEAIDYTFRPPKDAVASLGKVLADRKTLYKYLNPHIVGVVTRAVQGESHGVYLVDGVTGAILYHVNVPSSGGRLLAAMAENWLVFAYEAYGDAVPEDQAKGQRIVSVELYEGYVRNDKTRSSEISSHSPDMERLTAYQHSFLLPYSITSLGMTSTKYGISTKEIIVSTTKGQIHTIPRQMLDPRRHQEKPSAADGEEWLIAYDAVIGDDPRRVISRKFDVYGTTDIVTSPALLESTSLVFTHGLDLFFSKTAPSGTFDLLSQSFNKVQLILIIAALGGGIMVTRPIVQRRQLKQQWYS
ncbi:DUF1620-domain-containing protein [Clavulina sp. PMI_390]|nr:DUF1620-domain-containing protein [Clavulina sp. PMI_390]